MIKTLFFLFFLFSSSELLSNNQEIGLNTKYKIPRFVSLKSDDVNLRIGSSTDYPIILKYVIKNLPIEIIEEYIHWRKIKDIDNNIGWIHKSLIQGARYGIINNTSLLYNYPNGFIVGEIGNRNIVKINRCLYKWCLIIFNEKKEWIKKNKIWGVYKNEILNKPFYQPIIEIYWLIKLYFKN